MPFLEIGLNFYNYIVVNIYCLNNFTIKKGCFFHYVKNCFVSGQYCVHGR